MNARHPFGLDRIVYTQDACASSIAALGVRGALDPIAVEGHLRAAPHLDRTILDGVRAVPPGHVLEASDRGFVTRVVPTEARTGDLSALLRDSIAHSMSKGRTAVALSGGLDSAIVLALARQIDPEVVAYVVAPDMPGYSELEIAERTAAQLGVELRVVPATERDFVAALPEALVAIEEPLYNLHPVQRLLLGRALAEDGIEHVLTGDGIDQVMTRDTSADYVPLVHTLCASTGVTPHAPFLDRAVVAHLLSLPPDRDKRCVRALGVTLGIHDALTQGPKRSRLAPYIELGGVGVDERTRTLDACLTFLGKHFA